MTTVHRHLNYAYNMFCMTRRLSTIESPSFQSAELGPWFHGVRWHLLHRGLVEVVQMRLLQVVRQAWLWNHQMRGQGSFHGTHRLGLTIRYHHHPFTYAAAAHALPLQHLLLHLLLCALSYLLPCCSKIDFAKWYIILNWSTIVALASTIIFSSLTYK